ncbi:hypothetical protein TTHERM_00149960 (macronuclear) [Tetrahymena thermophila SB210]|uniref:Uncharacterized protein n=1 Tax=Tetrahymena thermophila (strain SB210) TaxID=312017 RepID=I7LWC7_TETTS|nr:hypothetical protein TTHERM_00149960 [Tetrahymena thermophila SB210]EAS01385.2 hypothetical protein TTHERM_00149960 [Tetrahymena thermophila SB210]|eukprot:XP_001021631.2 hypothetical protein TTHERM_00149960 [Tetrahymena thermophila SB210]
MNLQQVYNLKPQTAQNSHRIDKGQQDEQQRYSTPIQKKTSQTSTVYAANVQQQANPQFQSSSNNFYQFGKSIGSQQNSYISKSKQNQSNQNETKLPQFQTPQPLKELSKSQQQPHSFAQTQYSSTQYSIHQQKSKQPSQVMQNYLGTSEKEKQGMQGNTQMKIKKGQEVSKRIDFSNESNLDNLLLQGKGEEIKSSSSSEFTSQQESPVYGEKYSNDQLKQNAKLNSQNQGQQLSLKQQRLSVQSNQRVDSYINQSKQQQGEITNNQYSRPKSPNEIYSSQKQKPLSTQPKKLAETSENFYKSTKSPYEKLSAQTLKNFYISKSKPQEKLTGSRKRIYSTNQSDVSYNQKPSTSFSKAPQQDIYQNIDISLSSLDPRKQKSQNQTPYEFEDNQNEKEEKKEDFHSSVIDYNFDFAQFQNMQRPPCRKKLNTFNVEGIGANKGPIKPRHDIQLGESTQNPLRPPSRHKLPPKNLGLGFSESEESGEDIPVKEMFQKTSVEKNDIIFSNDSSLLKPKKLSDQFNLDQFSLLKSQEEQISKTFNLNEDRQQIQSREVQLTRPKSSRTNRSKSHISKQGTETQTPEDPLFDDDYNNNDILKQKKYNINEYVNQLDVNAEEQLASNRSQLQEKAQHQQHQNPSIASKVLVGSDIVIKHNVARKKPNLEKIQLPFDTKLGVEFIGLFANYQEGEASQVQTPQTNLLKEQDADKLLRQQQQQAAQQKNFYSTPSPHLVQSQEYDFGRHKDIKPDEFDDFEEEEEEQKFNPH